MSHMIMGPACGLILAQLGADVIKIEPPAGDKTRMLGGMGVSFFPLFNRGKRSVCLDPATQNGRDALMRLLGTADIFVENFRDETMAQAGLDRASLSEKFPNLIIAGHKGFLSGPYEHRPALDEIVQMMSGLAYMTGGRATPLRVGSSMNDIMGGMFGVIGILCALIDRAKAGKGKDIRVGLFENGLYCVAQHMLQFEMTGVPAEPMPDRRQAWPVYDIFDVADGQRVFVGVVTEGHWRAFCAEFGLTDLLADPTLKTTTQRIEARPRTLPRIRERLGKMQAADLIAVLDRLNIPFSPINAPEDLFADPHVLREGGLARLRDVDGRVHRVPAFPLELDGRALAGETVVPALGADTKAVLSELGYDDEEIRRMSAPPSPQGGG
jgi:crotonobetainyl-CoA:carnitine CoA-transferase CaiB-like acyl-CoA transferase